MSAIDPGKPALGFDKSLSPSQEDAILRALTRKVNPADRGDIEPNMAAAFAQSDFSECLKAIAAALELGRVILPVVPHAVTAESPCSSGSLPQLQLEKVAGVRAVPVFSCLSTFEAAIKTGLAASLLNEDAQGETTSPASARPLPVNARALALTALNNPGRILLDGRYLLPRPLLNALASGDEWLPAWENPSFLTQISLLVEQVFPGASWSVVPRPAGIDQLLIALDPTIPDLADALNSLQNRINCLENLRESVDLLAVTPVPTS